MVECIESSPARHRSKKQFYRDRTERSPALTDRIAPGPELVPGKFLWFSAGVYPARNGVLRRAERREPKGCSFCSGSRVGCTSLGCGRHARHHGCRKCNGWFQTTRGTTFLSWL